MVSYTYMNGFLHIHDVIIRNFITPPCLIVGGGVWSYIGQRSLPQIFKIGEGVGQVKIK